MFNYDCKKKKRRGNSNISYESYRLDAQKQRTALK